MSLRQRCEESGLRANLQMRALFAIAVLFALSSTNADCAPRDTARVEQPISITYGRLLVTDVAAVFTAPIRFDSDTWVMAAGSLVLIGGAMAGLDEPARDLFQHNRNRRTDQLAARFDRFGMNYPSWVMGGFYAVGLLIRDRTAKLVALDGLAVNLIAGNMVSPLLKRVVGRYRTYDNLGPHKYDTWSEFDSFPSGHVVRAFANAAVIAAHYPKTWVRIAVFGIATLVAYSRLNFDAHWLSDTMASAVIGTAIGFGLVEMNRKWRAEHLR